MEARPRIASDLAIKGSLIEETYTVFHGWDYDLGKTENLTHVRQKNQIGAKTAAWAQRLTKAIGRRLDPAGRDRPLVDLAKSGCDRDAWKPLLLFHLARGDFLVRDFLVHWLYPQFVGGAYRLRTEDVLSYLHMLSLRDELEWSGSWNETTTRRVASGLLRIAVDFGLLTGTQSREFSSYHLPEQSFLYLLHSLLKQEANARRVIEAEDWRMYLMDISDVERELLRLHQFRKLHYEVAGSLSQITLSAEFATDLAMETC